MMSTIKDKPELCVGDVDTSEQVVIIHPDTTNYDNLAPDHDEDVSGEHIQLSLIVQDSSYTPSSSSSAASVHTQLVDGFVLEENTNITMTTQMDETTRIEDTRHTHSLSGVQAAGEAAGSKDIHQHHHSDGAGADAAATQEAMLTAGWRCVCVCWCVGGCVCVC